MTKEVTCSTVIMESKQVLSIEQMQHLQELGLDTSNASMRWLNYNGINAVIPNNFHLPTTDKDYKICNTYTLQDVLDALPDFIDEYCLIIDMSFGNIRYDNLKRKDSPILKETYFNNEDECIIDAAYSLLCWAIEQGYVETKKNK